MNQKPKLLYKLLIKCIPLTVYLQSVTAIIITKGIARIDDPAPMVTTAYYLFLATIYLVQIIRSFFTKFLNGYRRGKWMYILNVSQFIVQTILVIGALVDESMQPYNSWIVWELAIFLVTWGSIMTLRFLFLLLIGFRVLRKNNGYAKLKQRYWLTITTAEQLFEKKGQLCYEQKQWMEQKQESLIFSEN